ncbi:hypothetical protein [Alteromonas sp. 14N.309.X.WAT.G.H12]|uniref:hypothetical protein n=1 Tax=Alteromonas sp. 14N.309.X.WAT.G.H12 TaxID=3120824 RepID=UPI002FD72984
MSFKTVMFWFLTLLSVTACGGGGSDSVSTDNNSSTETGNTGDEDTGDEDTGDEDTGDEDTGDEDEPTISMTATRVTSYSEIDEGEQIDIVYQLENPTGTFSVTLEPTLIGGASTASYSASTDESAETVTLSLQAEDESVKLGRILMSVTIEDEAGTTVTFDEDILATNPSGEEKIANVQAYIDGLDSFLSFTEEDELVDRLRLLSLMMNSGVAANDEYYDSVSSLADSTLSSALESSLDEATSLISSYEDMESDELDLDAFIATQQEVLDEYAEPVAEQVNTLTSNIDGLSGLTVSEVYIDQNMGTVSMFVGNSLLGSFVDGEWQYDDDYAFMNDISFPYTASCSAE